MGGDAAPANMSGVNCLHASGVAVEKVPGDAHTELSEVRRSSDYQQEVSQALSTAAASALAAFNAALVQQVHICSIHEFGVQRCPFA